MLPHVALREDALREAAQTLIKVAIADYYTALEKAYRPFFEEGGYSLNDAQQEGFSDLLIEYENTHIYKIERDYWHKYQDRLLPREWADIHEEVHIMLVRSWREILLKNSNNEM